jgi:hypothetical protein
MCDPNVIREIGQYIVAPICACVVAVVFWWGITR